jgi:recombination protein RecT
MTRTEELKQKMQARNGGIAGAAATVAGNGSASREVSAPLTQSQQADALAKFLASPAVMAQIMKALPRHLTADRLIRIATTELRKNPRLAQCTPQSFLGAVIQCAQLGLEPGSALGHVYLIPFKKNYKRGNEWFSEMVVTVIVGYRGMIDLARRSGQIESIEAWPVYLGDRFECLLGLEPSLVHAPDWENPNRTNPDMLRFVYAVARLKDGGRQFAVMSRAEVEMIRNRTFEKNKTSPEERAKSPWSTDFEQMSLKTVIRRLFKHLPVSIEMVIADALRRPESDELQLAETAALMLEDNASPTLDIPLQEMPETVPTGEAGGVAVNEAGEGPESLQTDFDSLPATRGALTLGERIAAALHAAQSRDVLDVAADEIRELASPAERAALEAVYRERCAALQ